MIVLSVAVLEFARSEVSITRFDVAETPVTHYARTDADGPVVVMAHGFAGSQQMMQGYALPMAQAGYRVYVFEFFGHGRHTLPMSGDVSSVDGTTRLLVDQTLNVMASVAPENDEIALVGHSMATDILVRVAATTQDVGPVVLISAFSQVVDATTPQNLLLISGAWEPRLRAFAQDALQMVDPSATEGQTVSTPNVQRRAVAVPFAEHVSVLHSRAGRAEAVAWLDEAYGRESSVLILPTGWAILGLLGGLVLLFRPVTRLIPQLEIQAGRLSRKQTAAIAVVPALLTPLIAVPLNPEFLPVLVADYLGLHLFIFGGLQLTLLYVWGERFGQVSWPALGLLLLWCALFGFGLDRYAANFWPTAERLWIIAVMMIGAVPYMIADAKLTAGASFAKRILLRIAFLLSLGVAVVLDFEGLFFLMLIAPVLVLFYLVFGTMGRNASARTGPLAAGIALGVMLAWALGVSFPLFQA